jgi:deoxyribodipyrimidine photo-lyase
MSERIRRVHDAPLSPDGRYVLYWMTAARRTRYSHALDHAVGWCRALGRPLLILEALRCDYRWATQRTHRFVIEGMRDNADRLRRAGIGYHPWVEPAAGTGRGLLEAMAADACLVVTDASPAFFLPRMLEAAAARLAVRVEAVDSVGLAPVMAAPRAFATALEFRRWFQKRFDGGDPPAADPLADAAVLRGALAGGAVSARWPAADLDGLLAPGGLNALPIDGEVGSVDGTRGGETRAGRRLRLFLESALPRYASARNDPAAPASSSLSPYLHFGHISSWQVFAEVAASESWTPARLSRRTVGAREGWWGMSAAAESFLDQLVIWRELGYNTAALLPQHDRYASLPAWARATLADHEADTRPALYEREVMEHAQTEDALWNAAQRQLRSEGVIHGYLRMLWGKRVLTWTRSGENAFELLLELNNRWALDGRDPNSTGGVAWVLGRYDRPWPERPVFGRVRAMTSVSTARKLDVKPYLERWGAGPAASEGQADLFHPQ